MTKSFWLAAVATCAAAAVFTTGAFAQSMNQSMGSAAGEADTHQMGPQPYTTAAHTAGLRATITKPLQDAIKLNDAQDYAGALAKIREADVVGDKTPVEEYTVAKFLGSVSLRLNDAPGAAAAFDRAVATNVVPAEDKPNIYFLDMALAAGQKNYARAITVGEMLAALGPLSEKASVTLAQAYYNKGDYANAVRIAKAALAGNVADGTVKAALLEVQTKGQAQSGDQTSALASLEQQCAETCDGRSWGQLIGVTMSKMHGLGNHQALNLLRLRLLAGGMAADDYLTMATLDMQFGLPAEAQSTLQKGIASGVISRSGRVAELLGKASTQSAAEERTLAAFAREAAAKAAGEEDVKLGETYYARGQYAEAEAALRRGLGKPGVRDRDDAQVTLGVVLLAAGKKADAVAALSAAGTSQAAIVHIWTLYANRKG